MSMHQTLPWLEAATAYLTSADPKLAQLVASIGPCTLTLEQDYFLALVDAIISQQISIKAAAKILERVKALCGSDPVLRPEHLVALPDATLREAGCSRAKALYLHDLSARLVSGSLDLQSLAAFPDEEVITQLVAVKGIGRWTAEMFLIFSLGRPDVWPVDDLGIVIAAQGLYQLPDRPKRRTMLAMGEPWRPFRTLASWYLWQSRRVMLGMSW